MTGVVQLDGCFPTGQRVAGWIPGHDTGMGCGFIPGQGMFERQSVDASFSHKCFSPSFFLLSPLSKNKNT